LGKKRIDLSGQLMSRLFESTFKIGFLGHARNVLRKMVSEGDTIEKKLQLVFDSRIMTKSF
jgi:hypothetical protein